MSALHSFTPVLIAIAVLANVAIAQPLGEPDRTAPGDEMIQMYLAQESEKLSAHFADDIKSLADWQAKRPQYIEEYYYMLGLSPRPEKSPLNATIIGTIKGDGYEVDRIHYQSRPRLYVTGNLYRPASVKAGGKLPAIFYVCGHSPRGRDGNKVAYQSHGIWFARHGYVCLVVDTLQLGEIAAIHHGTYRENRWWWYSRGYTPAGVEAWNGVRGIDYLVSRPDVDQERIAVTGISGGGAATFWVTAADDRVKVAVPVSGMADLESYVTNRVINGHCDCMFLYNTFQWPWTRIAGLVAPRPQLFVNSDQDRIFPMDANERITARLERLYSQYGASDRVDAVVSVGGHAYRQDIRQAAYRFINAHLKGDSRPITDSEIDIVSEGRDPGPYPIAPERLRVFPTDADMPRDELNTKIDEHFVPLAEFAPPVSGQFDAWKQSLVSELKRVSFGYFPDSIPAGVNLGKGNANAWRLQSEEGIDFRLRSGEPATGANLPSGSAFLLVVLNDDEAGTSPDWASELRTAVQSIVFCEPRGMGATKWTMKNPPNYIARSHVLLGRTVDSGRVWDVLAAAKYLRGGESAAKVTVAGKGPAGVLAAYAAILDSDIAGVTLVSPPTTHMDATAPQFLNVLRVCDIPAGLGLIAPRPLTITGASADRFSLTVTTYGVAQAKERLTIK